MNRALRQAGIAFLIAASIALAAVGDVVERTIEDRLAAFAQQLRMGLTLSTLAAYSPTIEDLRVHAQQLVNLLEGARGPHFTRPAQSIEGAAGLIAEASAFGVRFEETLPDPEPRVRVLLATKNIRFYLTEALSEALAGLEERRFDRASMALLRAYAYLLAAYERPGDGASVPGTWTILRAHGLAERLAVEAESETP